MPVAKLMPTRTSEVRIVEFVWSRQIVAAFCNTLGKLVQQRAVMFVSGRANVAHQPSASSAADFRITD